MLRHSTLTILTACLAFGQAAGPKPEIDVVSVRPSNPDLHSMGNHFSPGLYSYTGYSAKSLVTDAFGVRDYQVLNSPDWLRVLRWDVQIRTTAPADSSQRGAMFEQILKERFALTYHRDKRTMPVYSLEIAKGGLKLTPAAPDAKGGTRYGSQITSDKFDIRMLASALAGNLNLPIVDHTGLTGLYKIDLHWTLDPTQPEFGDTDNPRDVNISDPNAPPLIFTAIQQIGLELKSVKASVDVIVIDHIEHPTPN